MVKLVQVLDAGTIPSDPDMIFVKDMDGHWYKYKSCDGHRSYQEAIDEGRREPVTDAYAKSHVWPLSYGSGSLRVIFGLESVGEDTINKEIKHV